MGGFACRRFCSLIWVIMNTFDDTRKASSLKLAFFMALILSFCLLLLSSCHRNLIDESTDGYTFDRSISLSGHVFHVVLLDTPQERAKGLMGVTQLAKDHGALFIYPSETNAVFWMKDTPLALDMLFFDENRRLIKLLSGVPPCYQAECPRYSSIKTRYVLELKAGTADKHGIRLGDVFLLHSPS